MHKKADPHIHFEGIVDTDLLKRLCNKNSIKLQEPTVLSSGKQIPPPTEDNLKGLFTGFRDFANLFIKISSALKLKEDFREVSLKYLELSKKENTFSSDIYLTPLTHLSLGKSKLYLIECLHEASRVLNSSNHKHRWIFDIVRTVSKDGLETLDFAIKARESGLAVLGIALSGEEAENSVKQFKDTFEKANSLAFQTLAHAGESKSTLVLEETIEILKPKRIGHGISIISNDRLIEKALEEEIIFEVSPWSNILLQNSTKEGHPLKKMIKSGLKVVICSDDPGILKKSLNDNYLIARKLGVTEKELETIASNSLNLI